MYKITELEKKYVHNFYNKVARHWYKTRTRECSYWPVVINFINSIKQFSIVADIGTGSGRFMNYRDDLIFIGSDCSMQLLKICKQQNLEVICNNALNIPIRDNVMDITLNIAMLHHLSTEENRIQVIKELIRITKVNGQIFIYVWAF
jgi:tRNA (uracil-5-)-methyltransferase TRM9